METKEQAEERAQQRANDEQRRIYLYGIPYGYGTTEHKAMAPKGTRYFDPAN